MQDTAHAGFGFEQSGLELLCRSMGGSWFPEPRTARLRPLSRDTVLATVGLPTGLVWFT